MVVDSVAVDLCGPDAAGVDDGDRAVVGDLEQELIEIQGVECVAIPHRPKTVDRIRQRPGVALSLERAELQAFSRHVAEHVGIDAPRCSCLASTMSTS
jgi:hypothetical protein